MATDRSPSVWGMVLPTFWLVLGFLALAPVLEMVSWLAMIPGMLICGSVLWIMPGLEVSLLILSGGHGPPCLTHTAIILTYFIPAFLGFGWHLASAICDTRGTATKPDSESLKGDVCPQGADADTLL